MPLHPIAGNSLPQKRNHRALAVALASLSNAARCERSIESRMPGARHRDDASQRPDAMSTSHLALAALSAVVGGKAAFSFGRLDDGKRNSGKESTHGKNLASPRQQSYWTVQSNRGKNLSAQTRSIARPASSDIQPVQLSGDRQSSAPFIVFLTRRAPAYQRGVKKAALVQNTPRPRASSALPWSSALFHRPDHFLPSVEDRDQRHTWTGRIRQPCRVCTRRRTT